MPIPAVIALAMLAVLVGAFVGFTLRGRREKASLGSVESRRQQLLDAARIEAEKAQRAAELKAKELLLKAKTEAKTETHRRMGELQAQRAEVLERERRLEAKEGELRDKTSELNKQEGDLSRREQAAESMAKTSTELLAKAKQRLEELAKLSVDEARAQLMDQVRDEAKAAAAADIKKIEDETQRQARERATTIIATAIQRYASEYTAERTVSVVQLPGDDMKGRIIGREGRNIRALEAATGVDLIVDDTPEAVILSCFDPVRREVARLAIQRLIADGRIHPSRVEEVVKRCEEEVAASCKESAEQAVFDLGLSHVHPELVRLLGQLKFRSSYSQNLLQHSIEVGFLCGVIASELEVGVKMARRAGLLHDIGKAVAHETEGSHAAVGAHLAKKYGENAKVVHAIAAHHGEVAPNSVLAHIVDAANRLSAQRPGARRERLESYVQRLTNLEQLCKAHQGVQRAFAIQAGREVRVLVENDKISDEQAVVLSKDIAKEVEGGLAYPGQIRVCVIRESRATDVAR